MFASALRQVVRQASEGLVAEIGPAAVIVQILKENGTMDKHKLWQYCEDAGMKSKRQMKLTLRWLNERNHINIRCDHEMNEAAKNYVPPTTFRYSKKKSSGTPPPEDKVFKYSLASRYFPKDEE